MPRALSLGMTTQAKPANALVDTDTLNAFLSACQATLDADWTSRYSATSHPHMRAYHPRLSVELGRKYAKIVRTDGQAGSRSVFGFVDMTTGLVYKAASWKKAETNFPRGSVHGFTVSKWIYSIG